MIRSASFKLERSLSAWKRKREVDALFSRDPISLVQFRSIKPEKRQSVPLRCSMNWSPKKGSRIGTARGTARLATRASKQSDVFPRGGGGGRASETEGRRERRKDRKGEADHRAGTPRISSTIGHAQRLQHKAPRDARERPRGRGRRLITARHMRGRSPPVSPTPCVCSNSPHMLGWRRVVVSARRAGGRAGGRELGRCACRMSAGAGAPLGRAHPKSQARAGKLRICGRTSDDACVS